MGELRKVREGEPFAPSTKWQHGTIEAIEFARRFHSGGGPPTRDLWQGGIVQVKNSSGADRNRFDVLGIDDVFPTPMGNLNAFKNGPALEGITPTTAHRGKFVVLLEPLKSGKIGAAAIAGVTVAKVNIGDVAHTHASAKSGDAGSLKSDFSGTCQILWVEAGTGVRWAIVRLGDPYDVSYFPRPFELKTNLLTGIEAYAYWLIWDVDHWEPDLSHSYKIYDSAHIFRGWGRDNHAPGTRGWAEFSDRSNRWEIITEHRELDFELKTDLTHATPWTATAYLMIGGALETGVEFTIKDVLQRFRGRAKDKFSSPHDQGSRGRARWNGYASQLEILDLTPHALRIQGTANANYSSASVAITFDHVQFPSGGIVVDQDPAAAMNATNDLAYRGKQNNIVYCVWDEGADLWKIDAVQLQTFSLVSALRQEANKLEYQTRIVAVCDGDPSEWTTLQTLSVITVIQDVQYNSGSHAYEKKTVELTVQAGTPSGWTAFDTLTSATVMTDWQLNASTPAIEEKTRAGWGHWDAESGWTQIDTCNECEE